MIMKELKLSQAYSIIVLNAQDSINMTVVKNFQLDVLLLLQLLKVTLMVTLKKQRVS